MKNRKMNITIEFCIFKLVALCSPHVVIIAVSSHSYEERKQPQIIFLQCSFSVTMIYTVRKIGERKFMNNTS